jgi:hypothetical protein
LRPDCVDITVYFDRSKEALIGIMGTDPREKARELLKEIE